MDTNDAHKKTLEVLKGTQSVVLGVMLFGLFFGAGNVIFPVKMGQLAGNQSLLATLGFIITAVGLPILGIISSALSQSENLLEYASKPNKFFGYFFTIALYLTIGPGFAIPRTATVAFEVGVHPYLSGDTNKALLIYTIVFFLFVFLFAMIPNDIINVVGRFLTPFFLFLIGILLIMVFINPIDSVSQLDAIDKYQQNPVAKGMLDGYETMDALASLAFSIVMMNSMHALGIHSPRAIAKETAKSSFITILLFSLLYGGLVLLGASSRSITNIEMNGGNILSRVSTHYFGPIGQILLAVTVSIACLKTAIGLVVSISETFHNMFPKLRYRFWMVCFILFSFFIANFGLSQILQWSLPVLMFLYPLAIVLIILWILHAIKPLNKTHFQWTLAFTSIAAFFDFSKALPPFLQENRIVQWLLSLAEVLLPMWGIGLGWLLPAVLGFIFSLLILRIRKK